MSEILHQMLLTVYAKELGEIIGIYTVTCNPRGIYGR